jgi:hypothetical protein
LGGSIERQTRSARLLGPEDEELHITWKELKAVRLAVFSFLPHLAGRNVLLHEDNHAVCHVLAGVTSRSPEMMAELRRMWYMLDTNDIHIRPMYIRSAANKWADKLNRHLDSDDWQLDPSVSTKWTHNSARTQSTGLRRLSTRYCPDTTGTG